MIHITCKECGWIGRRETHTYAEGGWLPCPKCGRSGDLLAEDNNVGKDKDKTEEVVERILEVAKSTSDISTVPDYLLSAATTYKERNFIYKDNYKRIGLIYKALFPNGIVLKTERDYNRFTVLVLIISKLSRYTFNWESGHSDSLNDLSVYSAMLRELDEKKDE